MFLISIPTMVSNAPKQRIIIDQSPAEMKLLTPSDILNSCITCPNLPVVSLVAVKYNTKKRPKSKPEKMSVDLSDFGNFMMVQTPKITNKTTEIANRKMVRIKPMSK